MFSNLKAAEVSRAFESGYGVRRQSAAATVLGNNYFELSRIQSGVAHACLRTPKATDSALILNFRWQWIRNINNYLPISLFPLPDTKIIPALDHLSVLIGVLKHIRSVRVTQIAGSRNVRSQWLPR